MTRLTNNQAREAIHELREFTTGTGSLRGMTYVGDTGWMTITEEREQLKQASWDGSLEYVVYSYATPIAWVIDSTWVRSDERHSVTTSRHAGLCPVTGSDA